MTPCGKICLIELLEMFAKYVYLPQFSNSVFVYFSYVFLKEIEYTI